LCVYNSVHGSTPPPTALEAGFVDKHLRGLTTARLGEQALDIEGKKIAPEYMRPLFVGRTEADAYDRIMTRRTFPGQFR
jgi:hypothetical protein